MEAIRKIDNPKDLLPELLRIRTWLLAALQIDPINPTETDILDQLVNRELYLFVSDSAFAMVSFHQTDDHRYACYRYAGGKSHQALETILGGQTLVEQWVKSHGFEGLIAIGRKGWKRMLEPYGFKESTKYSNGPKQSVFVKRFE